MPGFRARAPLSLVLSGDEVAALGSLVDAGTIAVALAERATVEVRVREPGEWRARVRGLGRTLLVEPDLPAPADEGALAVEAHGLREAWRAGSLDLALDVSVEAPDAPDLGSLEARAEALAACLDALGGRRAARGPRTAAARAGSPSGALLGGVPLERASPEVARALEDRLVLVRDRHAPTGPSARLALVAWHSGDAETRVALERAAKASRAASALARGSELGPLAELVAEEENALRAIAPPAEREQRLEATLRAAGARVVRRLGERGLLALFVAGPDERARLVARASELNLAVISWRPGSHAALVEEVSP